MAPQHTVANTSKRGRTTTRGGSSTAKSRGASKKSSTARDPFVSSDDDEARQVTRANGEDDDDDIEVIGSDEERTPTARSSRSRPADTSRIDDGDDGQPEKVIPPALVAKLLQELFQKEGTRMTADASRATAKYMDVFVREAIARCMHEREGAFLEVSGEPATIYHLRAGSLMNRVNVGRRSRKDFGTTSYGLLRAAHSVSTTKYHEPIHLTLTIRHASRELGSHAISVSQAVGLEIRYRVSMVCVASRSGYDKPTGI